MGTAGHIGNHAARPNRIERAPDEGALQGRELRNVTGLLPPPGFGSAAERSQACARCVHENALERLRLGLPEFTSVADPNDELARGRSR